MVTYVCDLQYGYGTGILVVNTKNKKMAIDFMNKYLLSHYLDSSYNMDYIKKYIKKLEKDKVICEYYEDYDCDECDCEYTESE